VTTAEQAPGPYSARVKVHLIVYAESTNPYSGGVSATPSAATPGNAPGVPSTGGAVLVVDADPDLRELTATWLRLTGFAVLTASGPDAALAAVAAGEVTCVIVDHAPDAPAATAALLDAVRSRRPDCRTVVTSVLDAVDYPASDAALPKPFSRVQLIAAVLPSAPLPGPRTSRDVREIATAS
jgi:CheY-like chemotaxis protein